LWLGVCSHVVRRASTSTCTRFRRRCRLLFLFPFGAFTSFFECLLQYLVLCCTNCVYWEQ